MSDEPPARDTPVGDLPFRAYLTRPGGPAPRLRPGERRRDWMMETAGAGAMKCLPLLMANQHCWELLCPAAVEATWSGAAGRDALTLAAPAGGAPVAESHFGSGILTFSVHAVFRTPPGCNLWISGPPNRFKDGIQAMSALVESDWLPYTFSVNWQMTRPGLTVRFEADEPICALMPVARGLIERLDPAVEPLSGTPDLARQVATARLRRNAYGIERARGRDADPALLTQGWYMRGVTPDGEGRAETHQTSLNVRPFRGTEDADDPEAPGG